MTSETTRWKQIDAASYDDVAEAFDRHSRFLSGAAASRLAALAGIRATDRVLDVGTGTGLLPFELLHSGSPPASILGIDISSGMIDQARRRLHLAFGDDQRVRFEQMDAERLELEDNSFDLILSGFALTHIPQPELALREMYRVLRPGGRLAIALGSRPPSLSMDQLRHAIMGVGRKLSERRGRRITGELLDRIVGRLLGHSEHLPTGSPLSIRLNRAGLLRQLVLDAGFEDARRTWRNYQNEIEDVEEYWDLHRTIRSDVRKRLLLASPAVVEQVREEFVTACRRAVERGGVLASPISVVFVIARKPGPR